MTELVGIELLEGETYTPGATLRCEPTNELLRVVRMNGRQVVLARGEYGPVDAFPGPRAVIRSAVHG